jgi:hypothetical protein
MADGMTVDVVGLERSMAGLDRLVERVRAAATAALGAELEGVMEASKELCPIDTRALVESGGVSDPHEVADQTVYSLSYGGDNGEVYYALDEHENMEYRHAPGKEAKFLQKPLNEWLGPGPERAMRRAASDLGAG